MLDKNLFILEFSIAVPKQRKLRIYWHFTYQHQDFLLSCFFFLAIGSLPGPTLMESSLLQLTDSLTEAYHELSLNHTGKPPVSHFFYLSCGL